MKVDRRLLSSAACSLVLCSAVMHAAQAQVNVSQRVGGPGACQASLPSFEGLIRKRPLAIQNEGTSNAFVTCAPHQYISTGDPQWGITATLINNDSDSQREVSCIGVSALGGDWVYLPRSTEVPAGGSAELSWHEAIGDGPYINLSCALPPGIGISDIRSVRRVQE